MSEITESCLYHKDRSEFTAIQKEVQKRGWISQKYIHRLAMAVCSCRRHLRGKRFYTVFSNKHYLSQAYFEVSFITQPSVVNIIYYKYLLQIFFSTQKSKIKTKTFSHFSYILFRYSYLSGLDVVLKHYDKKGKLLMIRNFSIFLCIPVHFP